MTERVHVEFILAHNVPKEEFTKWLDEATRTAWPEACLDGYRADDNVQQRAALKLFVEQMEMKLRKNETKRNWREKPIEALVALMMLEVREFEVALEYFAAGEAKAELPDVANFAMMVWDRVSMLDQERNVREQNQPR